MKNATRQNAELRAEVLGLKSKTDGTETGIMEAETYKADSATKVLLLKRKDEQIASLIARLQRKENDLLARKAEVAQAVSVHTATMQEYMFFRAAEANASKICAKLSEENEKYRAEREVLEAEYAELKHKYAKKVLGYRKARQVEQSRKTAAKKMIRDIVKKHHALSKKRSELFREHTNLKRKAQNDIRMRGQLQDENNSLSARLQQELTAKAALSREIGRLRNDRGDSMDETGDNTWVQRASEAELLVKTQGLRIKELEVQLRHLGRIGGGKPAEPVPQPRVVQPLRASNIAGPLASPSAGPSAGPAGSSVASNAAPSPAGKRLEFAHMSEAGVRKEVSSYVENALNSVARWNRTCFTGSAGADKVVKHFSTMLMNWQYLQEDMIRDEKLLRALKSVVGTEGAWTTAPGPLEIMGGKEPARDRMVKVAKHVLARIEGTGQDEGSKGVKRTR